MKKVNLMMAAVLAAGFVGGIQADAGPIVYDIMKNREKRVLSGFKRKDVEALTKALSSKVTFEINCFADKVEGKCKGDFEREIEMFRQEVGKLKAELAEVEGKMAESNKELVERKLVLGAKIKALKKIIKQEAKYKKNRAAGKSVQFSMSTRFVVSVAVATVLTLWLFPIGLVSVIWPAYEYERMKKAEREFA